MESWSSSTRNNILFPFRYTSLVLMLLAVSGCFGRMPNLIPYGYGDVFDDSARASTAARVDYPILVSPNPNDPCANVTTFRVTRNGERIWWLLDERYGFKNLPSPFRPPKWYRLDMIYHKATQRLCSSGWVQPKKDTEVTPLSCNFDVTNYYSKPILGLLYYSMHDDGDNPPDDDDESTGMLSRTYFFIPND